MAYLASSGQSLDYVPPDGDIVYLGDVANYFRGCTYLEVLDRTHPQIMAACEQATRALGMEIAGVDIMCADISEGDFVIGEVNIGPGIQIHYFVENSEKRVPVAELVLRSHFDLR